MSAPFELTPQAIADLDSIWWFIARQNAKAADEVEEELVAACHRLAEFPPISLYRPDVTSSLTAPHVYRCRW